MMTQKSFKRKQEGFTLVEVAIVMVIIGLLIGGVLKGQAMIQNAKVKGIVKQADELRAAIMAFYDKYGMYPGDENKDAIPPGTDGEGDGDGSIETGGENFEVFRDLQLTSLISGIYDGTTDLPTHSFGSTVSVYYVDPPGEGHTGHNFVFSNMPADACLEIDTKYDDGVYNTGSIVASADYVTGTTIVSFYIQF